MEPRLKEKRWNHEVEKSIRKSWEREGVYTFELESGRPLFVIDTPPPYPSSV